MRHGLWLALLCACTAPAARVQLGASGVSDAEPGEIAPTSNTDHGTASSLDIEAGPVDTIAMEVAAMDLAEAADLALPSAGEVTPGLDVVSATQDSQDVAVTDLGAVDIAAAASDSGSSADAALEPDSTSADAAPDLDSTSVDTDPDGSGDTTLDAAGSTTTTVVPGWKLVAQATLPAGDWQSVTTRPGGSAAVWAKDRALVVQQSGASQSFVFGTGAGSGWLVAAAGRHFQDCVLLAGGRVVLVDADMQVLATVDAPTDWQPSMPAPRGDGTCAVAYRRPGKFGVLRLAQGQPAKWQEWTDVWNLEQFAATTHPVQGWWLLGSAPGSGYKHQYGAVRWDGEPAVGPLLTSSTTWGLDFGCGTIRGGALALGNVAIEGMMSGSGGLAPLHTWAPSARGQDWMDSWGFGLSTWKSESNPGGTYWSNSSGGTSVRADGSGHPLLGLRTDKSNGGAGTSSTSGSEWSIVWGDRNGNELSRRVLCSEWQYTSPEPYAEDVEKLTLAPGMVECSAADAAEVQPDRIALLTKAAVGQQLLWLDASATQPVNAYGSMSTDCTNDADCLAAAGTPAPSPPAT